MKELKGRVQVHGHNDLWRQGQRRIDYKVIIITRERLDAGRPAYRLSRAVMALTAALYDTLRPMAIRGSIVAYETGIGKQQAGEKPS